MITLKFTKTLAILSLILYQYLTHAQISDLNEKIACESLDNIRNLTITSAEIYVGPIDGANDPMNWVVENFECR